MSELKYGGNHYSRFYAAIPSAASRQVYANSLKHYLRFLAYETPERLIGQDIDIIEDQVISYIKSQKEVGLSSGIIRVRLAAIKLFYDMNKVVLSWRIINKTIGEQTKKFKDRPYKSDEIRIILDKADIRLKVMVLILSSSGVRIGALPDMRIGNLHRIEKFGIYQITVYEGTNFEYEAFCTPECTLAIDDYLAYRKRYGETLDSDSPLIRDAFDRDIAIKEFGESQAVVRGKRLGVTGMGDILRRALIDSGLLETKYVVNTNIRRIRHQIKRAHGFRKFYDTECTKAGVHPLYIELLMGHNIALKGSYFKPTMTDLLEGNDRMRGYISAIDALTINDEYRLRKEVVDLQEKVKDAPKLEMLMHSSIEKDLKIEAVLKELKEVRQQQKTQQEFMDQYYKGELVKPKE